MGAKRGKSPEALWQVKVQTLPDLIGKSMIMTLRLNAPCQCLRYLPDDMLR